jgi:hypothetical protein
MVIARRFGGSTSGSRLEFKRFVAPTAPNVRP